MLITCGLPGTWKTETNEDIFDEKVASDMDKRRRVCDETFRWADESLEKGDSVILDATFGSQSLRGRAAEIAAKHNKAFAVPANP